MKWLKQILKNWSFIALLASIIFLWYYFTFTPTADLDRPLALGISVGAILTYIMHSSLQGIRIQESLDKLNNTVKKGFDYRVVNSRDEFLRILGESIANAKKSIHVTHFDNMPPHKTLPQQRKRKLLEYQRRSH